MKGSLFGKRIYHFFKVDSTNRVALDLGHAGEPEGAVVLAEEQTAGSGRAGILAFGARAGIYVTLLLRPRLAPVQAPLLTMMAGLSAHAAIRGADRVAPGPEMAERFAVSRKESGRDSDGDACRTSQIRFVIVGIGLEREPGEVSRRTGRYCDFPARRNRKQQSRLELLVRLLREFETDYNRFLGEGAASVIERFAAISSYAQGKRVRVTNGAESFAGVTHGLGPEGLLLVKRDGGQVVTVIAGEVAEAR